MEGTVIGLIVGLIIAAIGGVAGLRLGKRQAVVSQQDIMNGIVTRKAQSNTLKEDHRHALHEAKVRADEVSKQIKEAPNEEIVRMFIDAFDKPTGHRGRR